MYEKEKIDKRVSEMREMLQELIDEKNNLIDPKVVAASQELDKVLNEYNNILNKTSK